MNLGDLVDMIRELEAAERDLADAKERLTHGGNEDTIKRKTATMQFYEGRVDDLRCQEIGEKP